jgi:hypothetical protein
MKALHNSILALNADIVKEMSKFLIQKKILNKLLEYVNIITKTEVNILLGLQGWQLQVSNAPIYTSIIDIGIPKSSFMVYELDAQQRISINYSNLYKLIKSFPDPITIQVSEYDLTVYNEDSKNNKIVLSMLNSEHEPIDLELDFESQFSISLDQFNKALNNIGKLSNKVKVSFNNNIPSLVLYGQDNYSKANISWNVPIQETKNISNTDIFFFTLNNELAKFLKISTDDAIIKYNKSFVFQLNLVSEFITIKSTFSLLESD